MLGTEHCAVEILAQQIFNLHLPRAHNRSVMPVEDAAVGDRALHDTAVLRAYLPVFLLKHGSQLPLLLAPLLHVLIPDDGLDFDEFVGNLQVVFVYLVLGPLFPRTV